MILALATGFAVGFIVLMVYFAGHGAGYVKGRNDYAAAVEWMLINDPAARRDLVSGLDTLTAEEDRRRAGREGLN